MKCYFLALVLLLFGCSKPEGTEPTKTNTATVVGISSADFGNAESSADIYVKFQAPSDKSGIREFRIIITKFGSNQSVTDLFNLPASQTVVVNSSITNYSENLPQGITDSDGEAIRNDETYSIKVLSIPVDENYNVSVSSGSNVSLTSSSFFEVKTLTPATGEAMSYHPDGYLIFPSDGGRLTRVNIDNPGGEVFDSGYAWALGGGFDLNRNIYYGCDYTRGQIFAYDLNGNKELFVSGMVGPIGIAVDDESNVFATNFDGNSISKITPDGTVTSFASSPNINGPDGLVFADGDLYSINFYDSRIFKISDTGTLTLFTTLPGSTTGYIAYQDGYFYVASISTRQIFKIDMQGNYESIAGNGFEGTMNGPAGIASFKSPNGIAISGDTIFVGDTDGIRMVIEQQD